MYPSDWENKNKFFNTRNRKDVAKEELSCSVGQSINLYNHLAFLMRLRLRIFLTRNPHSLDDTSEKLLSKEASTGFPAALSE